MTNLSIIYSDDFSKHISPPGHPENSDRCKRVFDFVNKSGLTTKLHIHKPNLYLKEVIELVHSRDYIDSIRDKCQAGQTMLDEDTFLSKSSYDSAMLSVFAGLTAMDLIVDKKDSCSFVLSRPPGHHAGANYAKGFCIFNNIAVLARYAKARYSLKKVFIFDFDVHHGNGTQDIFYNDPTVYYFSIHSQNLFPGTGKSSEVGNKKGKNFNLNIPLKEGASILEYKEVMDNILRPTVNKFVPDLLLVSAGFDGHRHDPLGNMELRSLDYKVIASNISDIAGKLGIPIISLLEGGYHQPSLNQSVLEYLKGL